MLPSQGVVRVLKNSASGTSDSEQLNGISRNLEMFLFCAEIKTNVWNENKASCINNLRLALINYQLISDSLCNIIMSSSKRYRREDVGKNESSDDEDFDFAAEGNDYTPYVPVKERNKQKLIKLGRVEQLKELQDEAGPRRSGPPSQGGIGSSSTANSSEVFKNILRLLSEIRDLLDQLVS